MPRRRRLDSVHAWHCQTCPDRRSALSVKPGSFRDMLEAGVLRDVCAFESRDVSSVLVSSPNASEDRQESRFGLVANESDYRALDSLNARRAFTLDLPPQRQVLEVPV